MKGSVQHEPIDIPSLTMHQNLEVGSLVIFQGVVRQTENSKKLSHLFYEAEEMMANTELNKILDEASNKFMIVDCNAVHRIGIVKPGEVSLLVVVQSSHRDQGFDACKYVVEQIKQRLPIWKKDHFMDNSERWH